MTDEGLAILLPDGTREIFETGEQRRDDDGTVCCPTACGPPCASCPTPPPSLSIAFNVTEVLPEFYITDVISRHIRWKGDTLTATVCLSAISPCVYVYVGPPLLATICREFSVATCGEGDGLCLIVVAIILDGKIYVRAGITDSKLIFEGVASWDCVTSPVVIDNTLVKPPNTDLVSGVFPYRSVAQGGTATVSLGTGFCETPGACSGAGVPESDECDPGCVCADFYKGKFNFDGNLVPFCLSVAIILGLPGQEGTACAWTQIADDFTARMTCELIDGVPTRVIDVKHATFGTFRFTQPIGDGCPSATWTAAYTDPLVSSAAVQDFESTAACETCPENVDTCEDKYVFEFNYLGTFKRRCLVKSGTVWQNSIGTDPDGWDPILQCNAETGKWEVNFGGILVSAPIDGPCPPETGWTSSSGDLVIISVTARADCLVPCDEDCADAPPGQLLRFQMANSDDGRLDTLLDGDITDPSEQIVDVGQVGDTCAWTGDGFKPEVTVGFPYAPLVYTVSVYCLDGWWYCEVFVADDSDSSSINEFMYRAPHGGTDPAGLTWELYSQTNGEGGSPTMTLEVYTP